MDIQLPQILFQAINFSVVMGALTFLLYKPVLKMFDERSQKISEGLKAAEAALKEKEELDQTRKKMESDFVYTSSSFYIRIYCQKEKGYDCIFNKYILFNNALFEIRKHNFLGYRIL